MKELLDHIYYVIAIVGSGIAILGAALVICIILQCQQKKRITDQTDSIVGLTTALKTRDNATGRQSQKISGPPRHPPPPPPPSKKEVELFI